MDAGQKHKDKYGETPYERLQRLSRENDEADINMEVIVHLSKEAGSDPVVIEKIAASLRDGQPFGLKCHASAIVFIPHQLLAYGVRMGRDIENKVEAKTKKQFLNLVKTTYLSHKDLVSTDELLGIAKLLQYEQQQKRLGLLRGQILPEPGQQAGSLGADTEGIIPGEDGRS